MFAALLFIAAAQACSFAAGQDPASSLRVSVVLNRDGSRTVYESDPDKRRSVATTSDSTGKIREKIRYDLDEKGRFQRGEVFGPNDDLRFRTEYKYDPDGRLAEEAHYARDSSLIARLVFRYDAAGHQTGYLAYDAAGRPVGQTSAVTALPPAKRK